MSRLLAPALCTAVIASSLALSSSPSALADESYGGSFEYVVKFICDVPQGVTGGSDTVKYATLVNIRNTAKTTADVCVENLHMDGKNGAEQQPFLHNKPEAKWIEGEGGLALGCKAIKALSDENPDYVVDGFLVINSTERLNVVAAYTVRDLKQEKITRSYDVETIKGDDDGFFRCNSW